MEESNQPTKSSNPPFKNFLTVQSSEYLNLNVPTNGRLDKIEDNIVEITDIEMRNEINKLKSFDIKDHIYEEFFVITFIVAFIDKKVHRKKMIEKMDKRRIVEKKEQKKVEKERENRMNINFVIQTTISLTIMFIKIYFKI